MGSEIVGFFAFPASHLEQLERLDAASHHSLRELKDDFLVRANELYRHTAAVALHRVELPGEDKSAALAPMTEFIRRARRTKYQAVYSPDDTRALADMLMSTEQRLGSEDEVVRRIGKLDREVPLDAIAAVYHACKEILARAAAEDLGFLWAVLHVNAEAELAEKRRQAELRRQEAAARPPLDPAVREALNKAFDEAVKRDKLRHSFDELDRDDKVFTAWLCVLADDDLHALRFPLRAGYDADLKDHKRKAKKHFAMAHEQRRERARKTITLKKFGVIRGVEALVEHLEALADAGDEDYLYSADRAAALFRALAAWEQAQGGEQAVIDELAAALELLPNLAAQAHRALKQALRDAVKRGAGLAWLPSETSP